MDAAELQAQYAAFTSTGGYVQAEAWGCLELTGKDAAKVLHGLCTNDILSLPINQGREAFFTDVKGHVLTHALILRGEDRFQIISAKPRLEALKTHCERYIIREDAALANVSEKVDCLLVSSPQIASLWSLKIGDPDKLLLQSGRIEVAGISLCWIKLTTIGDNLYLLLVNREQGESVRQALQQASLLPCMWEVWNSRRIEAGFPDSNLDLDEKTLPQEVGRDQVAISFNKGCYLGQETVARIDALGHVNRKLTILLGGSSAKLTPGMALTLAGKQVGTITSTGYSFFHSAPIALGFVRREQSLPGLELDGGITVRATN